MQKMKIKISKEEFDRISTMETIERNQAISDIVPAYVHMSYGYYNGNIREEDGNYYVIANIGDTCD